MTFGAKLSHSLACSICAMEIRSPNRVRLGAFELDPRAGELLRGTSRVVLQEQPLQILLMLVEARGQVITREEIKKRLWPNDTVVEFDHSIHTAIKKLRKAFNDSANTPMYVETVARRGYRLMVPVELTGDSSGDSSSGDSGESSGPSAEGTPKARLRVGRLTGKVVSHYRVLEVIGGGGMGLVYRAEDLKLGRAVALKFLPEEVGDEPKARERFDREARTVSALSHPNICPIYEFAEHEGYPFIAMELLQGKTLRDHLAGGRFRLTEPQGLDVAIQIATGLEAAHEKGIIHRDIKPANIFITEKNVAKILDFGVAKVLQLSEPLSMDERGNQSPVGLIAAQAYEGDPNGTAEAVPLQTPKETTLTGTGMKLGTAGYMSPEQVRGEPLDARTDIFSFGLVLYEMATGERAFTGNTAAAVNHAIVNNTPVPVRELNPELRQEFEAVINTALKKDRDLRYQSAAQMSVALQRLQEMSHSANEKQHLSRLAAIVALAVASIAGGVLSLARNHLSTQGTSSSLSQIKQRQLTTNSGDNRVLNALISPDGQQLAFVDQKGIHVKVISTGAVQTLPLPTLSDNPDLQWDLGPWFHDSKRLIAIARVAGQRPSTWLYPSLAEAPRKVSDDADTSDVSPDDSSLAFTRGPGQTGRDRETWIMGVDGQGARKLFELDQDSYYMGGGGWSPKGNRFNYQAFHQGSTQGVETMESRDFAGGPLVIELSTGPWWQKDGLRGGIDLPGGRTIYILGESDINGFRCDLWEIWGDEHTGKAISKPRQLTNWAGSCVQSFSASADGKRMAFLRFTRQRNIQISNLENGGQRISAPRLLTDSESNEYPTGWTADSKTVIFHSNRNGVWGIFRQALDQETPQEIVLGGQESGPSSSTLAPDGKTLIYTVSPKEQGGSSLPKVQVMRVPLTGGASRQLMTARLIGSPQCARQPANLCLIAERMDSGQMTFTTLDPSTGRGAEIARFATEPNEKYSWALAPDGKTIAIVRHPSAQIELLSLQGRAKRTIAVRDWKVGVDVPLNASESPGGGLDFEWAADGKGLFIMGRMSKQAAILFVDLKGNAHLLREDDAVRRNTLPGFYGPWAVPSPDGRYLAIVKRTFEQNAWMMENF